MILWRNVVSIVLASLWSPTFSVYREAPKCLWASSMWWIRAWKMRTCRRWRSLCKCLWVCCLPLPWSASSPSDAWSRCTSWDVRASPRAMSSEALKISMPSSYRWGCLHMVALWLLTNVLQVISSLTEMKNLNNSDESCRFCSWKYLKL